MRRFFTHYWEAETVRDGMIRFEGMPFDHTASNRFVDRGVTRGDRVYGVNIRGGRMFLIGRMTVDKVATWQEAKKILPYEPWDADDHLLAQRGTATPMSFHRAVPMRVVRELRFHTKDGPVGLKFRGADELDGQTLRGVRELENWSAELLDQVLDDR